MNAKEGFTGGTAEERFARAMHIAVIQYNIAKANSNKEQGKIIAQLAIENVELKNENTGLKEEIQYLKSLINQNVNMNLPINAGSGFAPRFQCKG